MNFHLIARILSRASRVGVFRYNHLISDIPNINVYRWDADYVQHWLRLDETRSALQQQMEYDAAELEDWTMDPPEDGGAWRGSGGGTFWGQILVVKAVASCIIKYIFC